MNNLNNKWLDFQPGIFTQLGLEINSLIDNGGFISKKEVHQMCDDYSIMEWLSKNAARTIGLWDDETKIVMAEEFCSISNSCDDEGELLVHNNGLSLLVAYCFEFIQTPPSRKRSDCRDAEMKLREKGIIS